MHATESGGDGDKESEEMLCMTGAHTTGSLFCAPRAGSGSTTASTAPSSLSWEQRRCLGLTCQC